MEILSIPRARLLLLHVKGKTRKIQTNERRSDHVFITREKRERMSPLSLWLRSLFSPFRPTHAAIISYNDFWWWVR